MEPEQIEKQLSWLDEQRRLDAETISRLTERLTITEDGIAQQTQQLQELSGELTRLSTLTTRIHQIDETLARHRTEVSRQLKDSEDRRSEKEKVVEELRKSDQKGSAKILDDIRADISKLEVLHRIFDTRKKEELRMAKTIDALGARLDDYSTSDENRGHAMASIDEGRKQDIRRVGELQAETSELRKKTETLHGELDTTDDRTRRLEIRLGELAASETERKEAQDLWLEQQGLKFVEFEREWAEWEKRFNEFEKMGGDLDQRMLSYEETYRSLKQLSLDLDDVVDRLERRINEITEMHRLNEDRLKQEWSTFQADDQKRWNTYKLTADELWREHNRLHEKMASQLQILSDNASDALRTISEFKESDQERMLTLLAHLRDWAADSK